MSNIKRYQVWIEGYQATGQSTKATYHGEYEGQDFKEAVTAFKDSLTDEHSRQCVDLNRMTFWGCKFFDNESDARKAFG